MAYEGVQSIPLALDLHIDRESVYLFHSRVHSEGLGVEILKILSILVVVWTLDLGVGSPACSPLNYRAPSRLMNKTILKNSTLLRPRSSHLALRPSYVHLNCFQVWNPSLKIFALWCGTVFSACVSLYVKELCSYGSSLPSVLITGLPLERLLAPQLQTQYAAWMPCCSRWAVL